MTGLADDNPVPLPAENPERWAYILLEGITDQGNPDPATRALAYAVLALVREQKKTGKTLDEIKKKLR